MKRVLISLALVVLLIGLLVAGCAKPAPAPTPAPAPAPTPAPAPAPVPIEPIELSLSLSASSVSNTVREVLEPWSKEIEEQTGGRVKIQIYAGELLGKASAQYDLTMTGVADMALVLPAQHPGRFPLSDVTMIPDLLPEGAVDKTGKHVLDTALEKYVLPLDFKETKALWGARYPDSKLLMVNKPVRTLEGMQGLVIGIPGGRTWQLLIKSLGGSPEFILVPDMYTALERGLIDGYAVGPMVLVTFKIYEVIEYITELPSISGLAVMCMGRETWDSLPPDIQKIIEELSPMAPELWYKSDAKMVEYAFSLAKEAGIEFIELSPDEKQRWKEATKHIEKDWAAELDVKGLPGTELINEIHRLRSE